MKRVKSVNRLLDNFSFANKSNCYILRKEIIRMNSSTLKEMGFSDLSPLSHLSFSDLPQNNGIVFAIINTALTGKPGTDIVYLGRAKKPARKLLGSVIAGYGGKNSRKINAKLFNDGSFEKAAVTWIVSDDPKTTQKDFLSKFVEEQGDSPVWNVAKKMPAKPVTPEPKKATTKPRSARKLVSKVS